MTALTPQESEEALDALRKIGAELAETAGTSSNTTPPVNVDDDDKLGLPTQPDRLGSGP